MLDAYIKPIIRTYLRVLAGPPRRGRLRRPVPDDALRRRGDDGGAGAGSAGQPHPLGPGRRRRRRRRIRRDHRRAEPRHRRHGRDEPRRLAGHRRPAGAPPGRPVRGAADQHLVAVHPHDRRRRRIDRLARRGRWLAGRPAERRRRSRTGVLRHRRRAADVHRRRPGDGLPRRGDPARRDAHAATRPGDRSPRADRPGARHVDPRTRPRGRAHLDDEDHRRRALDHRRARSRSEGLRPPRLRWCRGNRRRRRRQGAGHDQGDHPSGAGCLLGSRNADGRRAARHQPDVVDQPRRRPRRHGRQVLGGDDRRVGSRARRAGVRPRAAGVHLQRRCPLLRPGAHRHRPGPRGASPTRQRTSASSSSSSTASTTGTRSRTPIEVTTFRLSAVGVVDKPQLPARTRAARREPPRRLGSRADGRRRRPGGGRRLRPRAPARRRRARRPGGHRRAHGNDRDAPSATASSSATTAS